MGPLLRHGRLDQKYLSSRVSAARRRFHADKVWKGWYTSQQQRRRLCAQVLLVRRTVKFRRELIDDERRILFTVVRCFMDGQGDRIHKGFMHFRTCRGTGLDLARILLASMSLTHCKLCWVFSGQASAIFLRPGRSSWTRGFDQECTGGVRNLTMGNSDDMINVRPTQCFVRRRMGAGTVFRRSRSQRTKTEEDGSSVRLTVMTPSAFSFFHRLIRRFCHMQFRIFLSSSRCFELLALRPPPHHVSSLP